MSSPESILVVVDNTDPRIQYTGNWTTHGDEDDWYRRTFHSSGYNGDSQAYFHFTFQGKWVSVRGKIGRAEGGWKCNIEPGEGVIKKGHDWFNYRSDGDYEYESTDPNADILCGEYINLSPTETYTISMQVNQSDLDPGDWAVGLDYILYEPIEPKFDANTTIRIGYRHPNITHDAENWITRYNRMEVSKGFGLTFYGASATPYTTLTSDFHDIWASYSNDTELELLDIPSIGSYVPLALNASLPSNTGQHTLDVKVFSEDNVTPVYLDFIEIAAPPSIPSPSTVSSTSPSSSSTQTSPPSQDSTGPSSAAIIGIAVGSAIGALFLIVFLVLWLMHRRRKARSSRPRIQEDQEITPFTSGHVPFSQPKETGSVSEGPATSQFAILKQIQAFAQSHREGDVAEQRAQPEASSSQVVLIHSDSGVRIPDSRRERIEEVPPAYTAQ